MANGTSGAITGHAIRGGVLLLAACASADRFEPTVLTTTLPPETAAWVVAETCRSWYPVADAQPEHAGAPVLQVDEDSYAVRYGRRSPGHFRAWINGRLMPPSAPDFSAVPTAALRGIEFAPGNSAGGNKRGA